MRTRGIRRAACRAATAAVLAALVLTGTTGTTGAARAGAATSDGIATEPGTWACTDGVAGGGRQPVLLVHGTAMSAAENWATSYAPLLAARGRPVCTVLLPAHATGDVAASAEHVARTIRLVSALADGPVDVLGHSQGAFLPRAALRLHPDLADRVDDVVGLAGVHVSGSGQLADRCTTACVPALHQLARGSRLLRALGRRPLPAGPDYSNVGSLGDALVTPQPAANQEAGSTAVLVQDVCPGREVERADHAMLAGDAVAAALVLDALDHDGAVDPARVAPGTCASTWYDGFDPDAFLASSGAVGARTRTGRVPAEPTVACRLLTDCRDLRARGRLLHGTAVRAARGRVVVTAVPTTPGRVVVRVGHRRLERVVRAGRPVRVAVPTTRRGARPTVTVVTRAAGDGTWVAELRRTVRTR